MKKKEFDSGYVNASVSRNNLTEHEIKLTVIHKIKKRRICLSGNWIWPPLYAVPLREIYILLLIELPLDVCQMHDLLGCEWTSIVWQ